MNCDFDTHFNKEQLKKALDENLGRFHYNKFEDKNEYQQCFDYMLESWFLILEKELKKNSKNKIDELKEMLQDIYQVNNFSPSNRKDILDVYFTGFYKLSNFVKTDSLIGKVYYNDDLYFVIISQFKEVIEYYDLSYDEFGNFCESGVGGCMNIKNLKDYKLYGNYYDLMKNEKLRKQIGLKSKKIILEQQLKTVNIQLKLNK